MTGNIKDIYAIVHENMHKIYFQTFEDEDMLEEYNWRTYFNQIFLVEIPSLTAELLLDDYMERQGITERSYLIRRFNNIREYIY